MSQFWTCEYGANHGNGEPCDCLPAELPTTDQNELIVIEQLPIIRERLQTLGAEIDQRISEALALECTDDTVREVKAVRAALNKDFGAMEERRAEVKTAIMEPYEQFNAVYKEFVSDKYKAADTTLKSRISDIEDALKAEKTAEVRAYFEEYATSVHLDPYFINWEFTKINVTLSASEKSLKDKAKDYVDTRIKHLESIEKREHAAEILVEYRQSLSVMDAIEAVEKRHRLLAEQEKRRAELKSFRTAEAETVKRVEVAAPLAPPIVKPMGDDPIRTVAFKVTAPLSKLRELKKFLVDGGYEFE